MKRGRSTSAPSYRLHKATGQARVTINGKTHYLGKYGTEESEQRYKQALADHWNPLGTPPKPFLRFGWKEHLVRRIGGRSSDRIDRIFS